MASHKMRMSEPPKPATRQRRRKEERPGEILAAALTLFSERGFSATRLEDVADRAGIAKGTIYLYFQTKEDLFEAVVRDAFAPLLERLTGALELPSAKSAVILRFIIETL